MLKVIVISYLFVKNLTLNADKLNVMSEYLCLPGLKQCSKDIFINCCANKIFFICQGFFNNCYIQGSCFKINKGYHQKVLITVLHHTCDIICQCIIQNVSTAIQYRLLKSGQGCFWCQHHLGSDRSTLAVGIHSTTEDVGDNELI